MQAAATLRSAWRVALDFALPPRCAGCGTVVGEPHTFCLACWQQLNFLGEPCCSRCALPFEHEAEGDAQCGGCLAAPPDFDRLRAAVSYGKIARQVALKLKYAGRPGVALTMARFMARHLTIQPDTILCPVPLHRWRIWRRGYNQAALVTRALAKTKGLSAQLDVVERMKATPPLRGMGPRERRRTVSGAFRIAARHRPAIKGRSFLLIDDVYTTGATVNACARVLKRAGAARVDVLCWARVVRNEVEPVAVH